MGSHDSDGPANYQAYFGVSREAPHNEFDQLTIDYLFGAVYRRATDPDVKGQLSLRDRALINVALLAAFGRERELRSHLEAAFHQKFARDQLMEIMIHVAHYAGWPAGHSGLRIMEEVAAERAAKDARIVVDGSPMPMLFALPLGQKPHATIIVIHHGEGALTKPKKGLDAFTSEIVNRLARSGYAAIAPDLFHRRTPDEDWLAMRNDEEVIRDVDAVLDLAGHHPALDSERVGIIGFSMGGRVAYLMATRSPRLKAAVVYYGGNLMTTWRGSVAEPTGGSSHQTPLQRTAGIRCPLLFHYGTADTLLKAPGTDTADAYMRVVDQMLAAHGVPHEIDAYPGERHNFVNSFSTSQGAEREYSKEADDRAWRRTLALLDEHVRGEPRRELSM